MDNTYRDVDVQFTVQGLMTPDQFYEYHADGTTTDFQFTIETFFEKDGEVYKIDSYENVSLELTEPTNKFTV